MCTLILLTITCYLFVPKIAHAWFWWGEEKEEKKVEVVEVKTFSTEVHRLAQKYNQNENLALEIMRCEGQHYKDAVNKNYHWETVGQNDDGTPIVAWVHWSSDWGHWQINDYYHLKTAQSMGLDIKDEWGNLEYGFWLLSQQGTAPWNASKYCWGKTLGVDP